MAKHLTTGRKGEDLAVTWLESHGFSILHRNWRYSYFELDIIATRDHFLHFIEVKTRTGDLFGYPEEDVTVKKLKRMMQAGEEFQFQYPTWKWVQYDVLSIRLFEKREPEYFFIEDVSL
jgi:putative endonuclease